MLSISHTTLARAFGAGLGIALAALLLVTARPEARPSSSLPAVATFTVPVSGELEITPGAPEALLDAPLRPGRARVSETFTVRNQTAATLAVGFRASAESRELDGLLRVRLTSTRDELADTTLQGLGDGTASSLSLAPGASRELRLEIWIPPEVTSGYAGSRVDVSLASQVSVGSDR